MAKKCEICGRGPVFGKQKSASENKSPRRWNLNLQKVRVQTKSGVKKMNVCTSCIRSGKIYKKKID